MLTRDDPFGYSCRACGACCRDKLIRVNPFETMQLAQAMGLTPTDVLARYVERGEAPVLKRREDGRCVFFTDDVGCSVHPVRPLVCRLYPLGRHLSGDGVELFSTLMPHPESRGLWHGEGSVQDYLNTQQAEAWLDATDRLLDLFHKLLSAHLPSGTGEGGEHQEIDWLDIDQVLSVRGLDPHSRPSLEARFESYLGAMQALATTQSN
jgi:Fe-S-cluster containining protein